MKGLTLITVFIVSGVVLLVDAGIIDIIREKRNLRQQPNIYPPPQGIRQYQHQRPINSYPGGYNQRPVNPIINNYNQPGYINGGRPYQQPGLGGNGFGIQKQPIYSGSQSSSNSQSLSGGGHGGLSGSSSSSSSQSFSSGGGRGGIGGSSSQSASSSQSQGGRGGSGSQSNASSNTFSGK